MDSQNQPKPMHGILSLLFNIVIPVLILNKASARIGPSTALAIALFFPLCFGAYDLSRLKKLNPLSVLGFVNVLVTGGLAVLGLGGIWFAIKEAFFPFLIGLFVWLSAGKEAPLVRSFLLNNQTMHLDRIEETLKAKNKENEFLALLQHSTRLLSLSFFLSSFLNFALAQRIFVDLDPQLDATQKSIRLNEQIAQMTSWSMGVIVVPSTLFLIYILWHLLRGIRNLTGLKLEEILRQ